MSHERVTRPAAPLRRRRRARRGTARRRRRCRLSFSRPAVTRSTPRRCRRTGSVRSTAACCTRRRTLRPRRRRRRARSRCWPCCPLVTVPSGGVVARGARARSRGPGAVGRVAGLGRRARPPRRVGVAGPGYTLLTFVLGFDPVTGRLVVPRRRGAASRGGGAGARRRGADLPGALAARRDRAGGRVGARAARVPPASTRRRCGGCSTHSSARWAGRPAPPRRGGRAGATADDGGVARGVAGAAAARWGAASAGSALLRPLVPPGGGGRGLRPGCVWRWRRTR